jgi:hypothetical protein
LRLQQPLAVLPNDVEVGRPDSFRAKDSRWPSYFLFEPWLNFGWRW